MLGPDAVGLTPDEGRLVRTLLGRAPTDLEWGLFGALWSEHCSYKSSKNVLAWLKPPPEQVVGGPGDNAGVVRLNAYWEVAFKVESHNHPSYVEPFHGAATGVGGIIRDVVAMGAYPVALMDSLRFGPDATRLQEGVVRGIGFYGNAIGVPTVGGELSYGAPYRGNPLVNVLCVGVRRPGSGIAANTSRPGDRIVLVGADTGRDGIHGASLLASRSFAAADTETGTLRPAVQVGDPFTGRMVMEAMLAVLPSGHVHAMQDLGAAGLSSALAEMAGQGGVGVDVDVDRVPRRERGMSAYEVMLSETQERMLLTVSPEDLADVLAQLARMEVRASDIGAVTADGRLTVREGGTILAAVPAASLTDGAPRRPAPARPSGPRSSPAAYVPPGTFGREEGIRVLRHPECRSKASVYHRYDYMVQTHTVKGPGDDGAVLHLDEGPDGLVIAVDGPGRLGACDAYTGGARAVLEAVTNVTAMGGHPIGLSDGLNLGSPEDDGVFQDFAALVAGIADASHALQVPVTGGNVSFYNQTGTESVWPTAVIAAVGRHPDPEGAADRGTLSDGMALYRLGAPEPTLAATVWRLEVGDGCPGPATAPDWTRARAVLEALSMLHDAQVPAATHDVSDGGLFVTLAEMLLAQVDPMTGMAVTLDPDPPVRLALFNEGPAQVVVAVPVDSEGELFRIVAACGCPARKLGEVTRSGALTFETCEGRFSYPREELRAAWTSRDPDAGLAGKGDTP